MSDTDPYISAAELQAAAGTSEIRAAADAYMATMIDRPLPKVGDKIPGPWEDGEVTAFDGRRMTIAVRMPVQPADICLTIQTGAAA